MLLAGCDGASRVRPTRVQDTSLGSHHYTTAILICSLFLIRDRGAALMLCQPVFYLTITKRASRESQRATVSVGGQAHLRPYTLSLLQVFFLVFHRRVNLVVLGLARLTLNIAQTVTRKSKETKNAQRQRC